MKNRVNISKLIEEKYKDKDDTFSLKQLNEMIDSLLDEGVVNYSYGRDFDTLEENPESVNIHQRMYGVQGDRNPLANEPGFHGREPSNVSADKLAEAPLAPPSSTVPATLKNIDILSLVSNQNLELASSGDDDRLLIDNIIRNFGVQGKKNWISRIETLNNFIRSEVQGVAKGADFRQAISRLIYINLLKRMSFFVAQPGKMFEYIIAPLIGPDAKVVGGTSTDILDVTRQSGYGYSIKFFTGEKSNYIVQGSSERLLSNFQKQEKENPGNSKAITYILAVAKKMRQNQDGYIEFIELSVSPFEKDFSGYTVRNKFVNGHGYLLQSDQGGYKKYGLYVNKYVGDAFGTQTITATPEINAKQIELQDLVSKLPQGFDPKQLKIGDLTLDEKSITIYNSKINSLFDSLKTASRLNDTGAKLKHIDTFKKYDAGKSKIFDNLSNEDLIKKAQEIKNIFKNYYTNLATFKDKDRIQKEIDALQLKLGKVPTKAGAEITQFQFSLEPLWDGMEKTSILFLGNPKTLNQQEMNVAQGLQETITNVMNEFDSLGKNLLNFFATSKAAQRKKGGTYGNAAMTNAENIHKGIDEVIKVEGPVGTTKKSP